MNFRYLSYISILAAPLLLTACGGSDEAEVSAPEYEGLTSSALIEPNNQLQIANSSISIASNLIKTNLYKNIPSPFDYVIELSNCSNGSISSSGSIHSYNDFCFNDAVVNGTVNVSLNTSDSVASYSNFNLNIDANEYILNGSMQVKRNTGNTRTRVLDFSVMNNGVESLISVSDVCSIATNASGTLTGSPYNCSASVFTSVASEKFKVEEFQALQDPGQAWDIDGKLFIPEYGYVTFSANNLVECASDLSTFESGSISIVDESNNSILINTFDRDCILPPEITFTANPDSVE